MFPRLRQSVLAHADVLVELVTLGEFGLDERGVPIALADLDAEPGAAATAASCRPQGGGPACAGARSECLRPASAVERRRGAAGDDCVTAPCGAAPARP